MDLHPLASGARPPADELLKEIIFDQKCYNNNDNSTRLPFLEWCSKGKGKISAVCLGLGGSNVNCTVNAEFDPPEKRAYVLEDYVQPIWREEGHLATATETVNSTTSPLLNGSSTIGPSSTVPPPPDIKLPKKVKWEQICPVGLGKNYTQRHSVDLTPDKAETIMDFCEYQLDPTRGMAWWLILILVLLTIAGVSAAFALFWKYWLRRRIYGKEPGETSSRVGSSYTSAPISSMSGVSQPSGFKRVSQARPSTSGAQFSRASGSGVPSGRSSTRLHSRSGSLRANNPSVRSSVSAKSSSQTKKNGGSTLFRG